jgi:hypothetical protein
MYFLFRHSLALVGLFQSLVIVEVISINFFFRKLESPQALKLLQASSDDSNRKQILGVSSTRILGIAIFLSNLKNFN